MFRVIIAGSRDFKDYDLLCKVCDYALQNQDKVEVVSGKARGADALGERYAKERGYPIKEFPADWRDLTDPCVLKYNDYGPYNALAGHKRNAQMAEYGDGLISFWDGKSHGSKDMIELAEKHGLKMKVTITK